MATLQRRAAPKPAATEEAPSASSAAATQARAEKIHKDLDALIDEIDEALQENAEEFVTNYVQRGGE